MQAFQPGDVPVPGYKLNAFRGKGSYGEVWKAVGPGGVECALKFINLDSRAGLKEFRGIGRVQKLKHPNLVPIFAVWLRDAHGNTLGGNDAGESLTLSLGADKQLVLAMGLGEKSLLELLILDTEVRKISAPDALPGGLGQRRLLKHMADAAAGIDYLNILDPDRGGNGAVEIVHCDIKPGNLLLVGGGVQVCDYGVAQALDRSAGQDTHDSMAAGTAGYAAPELINNEPGPWTDQYCLAISYYELRTGQLPFPEDRALQAHLLGTLDFSRVPPAEQVVLKQATAMQPDKRFPTCGEFVEALRTTVIEPRAVTLPLPAQAPTRDHDPTTDRPRSTPPDRIGTLPQEHPVPIHSSQKLDCVGDYTLLAPLGEGGMGTVYHARHRTTNWEAAVKVIRPELAGSQVQRKRFLREAQALFDLDHPHVVRVWHFGEDGDRLYLVMPLLRGETLQDRLKRDGPAPPGLVARVGREMADALTAAHARKQIHRDIKPANIWLEGDRAAADPAERVRRTVLLDFGIVRLLDATGHDLTQTGMPIGTPAYMSPEQARDEDLDHRTDIFSLGMVLYEMATGTAPFRRAKPMQSLVAVAHAADPPPPPAAVNPAVPGPLSDLIRRMTALRREDRVQSMGEVSAEFARVAVVR